jgi:MoaE-MoaD fusion protein
MEQEGTHAVTVEYFAGARELCGVRSERVALPAARVRASELLALLAARHAALAPVIGRMRLALNGEIVLDPAAAVVAAGDSLGVLPPVAGGSDAPLCELRAKPLSVDEVLRALRAPEVGGIALFIGTVRDHAAERKVVRLDYEAHPELAVQEMARILGALRQEYPGVRLAALHRTGELPIGELAVIVGASAPHRAEAFAACRAAIERIKERVPIWKKEWADDGTGSWVNLDG